MPAGAVAREREREVAMVANLAARTCLALGSVLLIAGCTKTLETLGPTPADEGIVIYVHADFAGTSQAVNHDVSDLANVEGPCTGAEEGERPTWHDCMSSLRVVPGWTVTLYRDREYKGSSVTLTQDAPNLKALPGPCDGSFNDCVSSIRVSRR
jgi:hypothetical protein